MRVAFFIFRLAAAAYSAVIACALLFVGLSELIRNGTFGAGGQSATPVGEVILIITWLAATVFTGVDAICQPEIRS